MKKMLKRTVFFLGVIATLSPVLGQAFNPAAHVYIAGKVAKQVFPFTFDKINLYYGSIAPDISSYADIARLAEWILRNALWIHKASLCMVESHPEGLCSGVADPQ